MNLIFNPKKTKKKQGKGVVLGDWLYLLWTFKKIQDSSKAQNKKQSDIKVTHTEEGSKVTAIWNAV